MKDDGPLLKADWDRTSVKLGQEVMVQRRGPADPSSMWGGRTKRAR